VNRSACSGLGAAEREETRPVARPMESSARSAIAEAEKAVEEPVGCHNGEGDLDRMSAWSADAEAASTAADSSNREAMPTLEVKDL